MSDTKERKKDNLFAKLAGQQPRAVHDEPAVAVATPPVETPHPPAPVAAPVEAKPKPAPVKKKAVPVKGKRDNPDYCQANAYVPKTLRRVVEKTLLDIDGLDYSMLVEDLLRKWLKSRGVSE